MKFTFKYGIQCSPFITHLVITQMWMEHGHVVDLEFQKFQTLVTYLRAKTNSVDLDQDDSEEAI